MNTLRYLGVLCWNLVTGHLIRMILYLPTLIAWKKIYWLKCCFKDQTYFLKLNNLLRELMQHCLEEGSKGGKTCNSQSSNGSNQEGMEKCQWGLVCWSISISLVNNLGSSNNIILVGRADQFIAIDVERLGIWKVIVQWDYLVLLSMYNLSTLVVLIWCTILVSHLVLYILQLTHIELLLCLLCLLHLLANHNL